MTRDNVTDLSVLRKQWEGNDGDTLRLMMQALVEPVRGALFAPVPG